MPEALSDAPLALFWVILTALVSAAVGGIGAVFYRASRDKLSESFERVDKDDPVVRESELGAFAQLAELEQFRDQVTRDLNALGGKVTSVIDLVAATRDRADTNADAIIRLQEADRLRWEPVAEALEQIGHRMGESERTMARVTTLLDEISRRLDRHENAGRH